jgi:hypothetical protein
MLFLIYPSTSNTILKMFSCRKLENGRSYLMADYSIECGDAKVQTMAFGRLYSFTAYQYWAGFAVLAFPLGIPILFFLLLWLHRNDLFEEGSDEPKEELRDELGFLYAGYRKQYWWWESVELFRKLALTGILAFFKPGTPEQLFMGIVLAVVFIVGYAREKPYLETMDSDVQLVCQLQVFFVSVSAFAVLTTAHRTDESNPFTSSSFSTLMVLVAVLPMIVVAIQIFFFGSSDSLQHLGGAGRGTTLGSLPSDDNAGQGGKGGGRCAIFKCLQLPTSSSKTPACAVSNASQKDITEVSGVGAATKKINKVVV